MPNKYNFDFDGNQQARVRRMLGLREFKKRDPAERQSLLGSQMRTAALENITTSTLPISKKEVKKGIVLELVEQGLIDPEILKSYPLVYIGSGVDVEYPLALGGRKIQMLDPILDSVEAKQEVLARIKSLTKKDADVNGSQINFKFDFGGHPETVSVDLVSQAYPYRETERTNDDFQLPENTGVIVLYASQGPSGAVQVSDKMRERLVKGGIIIKDHEVIQKDGKTIELGE